MIGSDDDFVQQNWVCFSVVVTRIGQFIKLFLMFIVLVISTAMAVTPASLSPPSGSKESDGGTDIDVQIKEEGEKRVVNRMLGRRPSKIVVPENLCSGFVDRVEKDVVTGREELVVEGDGYWLVSKRGKKKKAMEDGYGAMTNINGDSRQIDGFPFKEFFGFINNRTFDFKAYFGVFDGHGGCAAVDFVSEKLGKNIIAAVDEMEKRGYPPEMAIRSGYLTTDRDFLNMNLGSGACAATVLLKDGEIHSANVGDCKIVMSRKGVAFPLTTDHRADVEQERDRIENSGGCVEFHGGVWRVQGSLSISRAIGDLHMKELIIAEPETTSIPLTSDCDFLILASDGLWDKVSDQEAVDVVVRHKNNMKSCTSLIEISSNRGRLDDITVMVVDLKRFFKENQSQAQD